MHRAVRWLTLLLVLAGCRNTRSESGRTEMPNAATRTDGAELREGEPGVEFEAPRLIPAIRAHITEIRDPEAATEGNLTALKAGVRTLVNAMKADLNRVGVTDSRYFYSLSDSVLRAIGGADSDLPDRVERLIGIYEERMRKAAN